MKDLGFWIFIRTITQVIINIIKIRRGSNSECVNIFPDSIPPLMLASMTWKKSVQSHLKSLKTILFNLLYRFGILSKTNYYLQFLDSLHSKALNF